MYKKIPMAKIQQKTTSQLSKINTYGTKKKHCFPVIYMKLPNKAA